MQRSLALACVVALGAADACRSEPPAAADAPARHRALFADFETLEVDPRHLAFAPQYPLWTDGAAKRRWISLPPGTAIDASDPDAWVFPVGTRFWKEFSFGGRRVETRFIERLADGRWRYAAYEWSADGRDATLAPEQGRRGAFPLRRAAGRTRSRASATAGSATRRRPTPVLGFSLLQLSPDRDPGAPHAEPGAGRRPRLPGRRGAAGRAAGRRARRRRRASARRRRPSGPRSATCTATAATATTPTASCRTSSSSCATSRARRWSPGSRPPSAGRSRSRRRGRARTPCCASTRATRSAARWCSGWARAGRRCRCRRSAPSWWTRRRSTLVRHVDRRARELANARPNKEGRGDDELQDAAGSSRARPAARPAPAQEGADPVAVGEYLVDTSGCHDCHTPLHHGAERPGAGHDAGRSPATRRTS